MTILDFIDLHGLGVLIIVVGSVIGAWVLADQ